MKILIVDDEVLALKRLEGVLKRLGYIDFISTTSESEALQLLNEKYFDILISDIEMPNMSGIELAQKVSEISPKIYIIFQTAYDKYAIDAFKVGAVDYILKPFSLEDVDRAITRALNFLGLEERERVISRNGDEFYLLKFEDIVYIKAELSEVMIRTVDGYSYHSKQISQIEAILKPFNFFRIHRSYIINLDKIKEMETTSQSRIKFQFHNIPETIESSREGAKLFRNRFY